MHLSRCTNRKETPKSSQTWLSYVPFWWEKWTWIVAPNRGPIVDYPGLGRVGEGLSQEAMTLGMQLHRHRFVWFFFTVFLSGRGLQEPFATHQEVCAVLFRITAEFEVQKPQKGNLLSSNLARRTLGYVRVHQKRPRTFRIRMEKSMSS